MTKVQEFPKDKPACPEMATLSEALKPLVITSTSMGAVIACEKHQQALSLDLVTALPPEERTFVPDAEGWVKDDEMAALYEMAIGLPEEMGILLEIGSYKGRSTSALALAGHVVCIDTFNNDVIPSDTKWDERIVPGKDTLPAFLSNMESVGLRHRVVVLRGKSDDVMPMLRGTQVRVAFIDGAHDYTSVFRDITNAWELLTEGGFVVIDDYDRPEVKKAADDFAGAKMLFVQPMIGKLASLVRLSGEESVKKLIESQT